MNNLIYRGDKKNQYYNNSYDTARGIMFRR